MVKEKGIYDISLMGKVGEGDRLIFPRFEICGVCDGPLSNGAGCSEFGPRLPIVEYPDIFVVGADIPSFCDN
jgi:hypothetical protein